MAVDTSRLVFFIFVFIFLFASPDNSSGPTIPQVDFSGIISKERGWLTELQNSTYGNVGNLTGYTEHGWWSQDGIGIVRGLVGEMVENVLGSTLHPKVPAPKTLESRDDSAIIEDEEVFEEEVEMPLGVEPPKDTMDTIPKTGPAKEIPLYHNITGMLSGEWKRLDVPELLRPTLNATLDRNVTDPNGQLWLVMTEDQPNEEWEDVRGVAQRVRLNLQLKNEQGGNAQTIPMRGIHFVDTGLVVGVTSSDKFSGVFGLPHLTPTETTYELTKGPQVNTLKRLIEEHEYSQDPTPPWQPLDEQFMSIPNPHCEYIIYIQIHPIHVFSVDTPFGASSEQTVIDSIEREIRRPSGEPLPLSPPDLIGSAIIYSPDCGFVLSSTASHGLKIEVYHNRISHFALASSLLTIFEIFLLIRQMNSTSTPSTLSRVSFWTIGILSVVGGYTFIGFLTIGLYIERCFLQLLTAAFLSLLFFMFFGMRYLMSIYRVQRPERETPSQQPQQTAAQAAGLAATARANPPPPAPVVEAGGLPLPVTAAPGPPPPLDTNDAGTDASTLSTRLYLFLMTTLFLTFYSFSWPPLPQYIFHRLLLLLSLSFFVPQIYRNSIRNCRKALKWEFILGISLSRLLAVYYIFGHEGNVLWIEREDWVVYVSVGWVWTQVWVLGVQEMFGPRFLVPENLLPAAYDYHPILPLDDLEAAQPVSPTHTHPKEREQRSFDCAICMQPVELPLAPSSSSAEGETGERQRRIFGRSVGGWLGEGIGMGVGRRSYMVTPCKHVFHSVCLEGWMRVRLQCPICRNTLPPV